MKYVLLHCLLFSNFSNIAKINCSIVLCSLGSKDNFLFDYKLSFRESSTTVCIPLSHPTCNNSAIPGLLCFSRNDLVKDMKGHKLE